MLSVINVVRHELPGNNSVDYPFICFYIDCKFTIVFCPGSEPTTRVWYSFKRGDTWHTSLVPNIILVEDAHQAFIVHLRGLICVKVEMVWSVSVHVTIVYRFFLKAPDRAKSSRSIFIFTKAAARAQQSRVLSISEVLAIDLSHFTEHPNGVMPSCIALFDKIPKLLMKPSLFRFFS